MRKSIAVVAFVVLAVCVCTSNVRAAESEDASKPIRILLTYGGHGFNEKPFFEMFDAVKAITYTKAPMPKSADMLKPGLAKQFDVIVMFDMVGDITPEQQKAFTALLEEGIGVVSLHHNIGAHRNWPEFTKIIGGKFFFKPRTVGDKKLPKSGYAHGQDMDISIADKQHPITRGLKDFTIHDECYDKFLVTDDAKVLLTTDHPKNDPQIAWVKQYGKSPVFYLMLGHDAKAWTNKNFSTLIQRGIQWAGGELK